LIVTEFELQPNGIIYFQLQFFDDLRGFLVRWLASSIDTLPVFVLTSLSLLASRATFLV
jgi:hypothetical protein